MIGVASSSGWEEFHCTMASPAHGVDAGPLTPPLHPRRGAGRQERRGESVPSLRVVTKKGSGWGGSCVTGGIAAAKVFIAVLGGPRERRRGGMSLRRGERPTYVRPRHRLSPLTLMPVTAESVTVAAPTRLEARVGNRATRHATDESPRAHDGGRPWQARRGRRGRGGATVRANVPGLLLRLRPPRARVRRL